MNSGGTTAKSLRTICMISFMVCGVFSFHLRISSWCASHQRLDTGQLWICARGVPTTSRSVQWRGMRSFTWLTHCLWDKSGSMAAGWAGRSQSKTCPPSEAAGACHDIECITAPSCCMSRPADWVRVAPRKTLRHHHSREHLQTQAKHVHELTLSAPETTVCESSAHALVCKIPI